MNLILKNVIWIVKQRMMGISPSKLALAQGVSKRTIRKICAKYKEGSFENLKDHKTGRPETRLNKNIEIIILDLRKRYRYDACRMEQILNQKGFSISHRQIEKLLIRNNLVKPNVKKQKSKK